MRQEARRIGMPAPKKVEDLQERRIFMMGNGKSVRPKDVRSFNTSIKRKLMDGRMHGHEEFAMGFAACLDAISRGTIDLEEHPANVVSQAWADVNNVTTAPNKVTSFMKAEDR